MAFIISAQGLVSVSLRKSIMMCKFASKLKIIG